MCISILLSVIVLNLIYIGIHNAWLVNFFSKANEWHCILFVTYLHKLLIICVVFYTRINLIIPFFFFYKGNQLVCLVWIKIWINSEPFIQTDIPNNVFVWYWDCSYHVLLDDIYLHWWHCSMEQKQLAYMLGRQQIFLELDEEMDDYDELVEIICNVQLNNNFLALGREVRCNFWYICF